MIDKDTFIKNATRIHGDKYDYSKSTLVKSSEKICIICPIHGEFWQTPSNHLAGKGCKMCGSNRSRDMKRISLENTIKKASQVHGNKYDYSKLEYKKIIELNTIICPAHGEFKQSMNNHINNKHGCPVCAQLIRNEKQTSNTNEFIDKSILVHGDKYDYSKVDYKRNHKKVKIICKKHGEFEQMPLNHLKGEGCPYCGNENTSIKQIKSQEQFIIDAIKVHGNKYDYSKVKYIKYDKKICIICPTHGEFWQTPSSHINSNGCKFCSVENAANSRRKSTKMFINDAIKVHGIEFDYSNTEYTSAKENVKIICKKHGEFWQTPDNHLQGKKCAKCSISTSGLEKFIKKILKKVNINYIEHDRKEIEGLEIDIYIPSFKLGIELNGIYWHNEQHVDKQYHIEKLNKCKEKGIKLIQIFEDEINMKPDIVESMILNAINKTSNKIYGRNCTIKQVENNVVNDFLDENHIQGKCRSSYRYGLFYNDEMISVMTFGKPRVNLGRKNITEGEFELLRFCNKKNTTVTGGASKLLNHFIKDVSPKCIYSYCDKRWSNGNLYEKIGFVFEKDTQPNYFYVIKNKRENRFSHRKDALVKMGFDKNKTEHEIMLERKIYRIYDCGNKLYKMII